MNNPHVFIRNKWRWIPLLILLISGGCASQSNYLNDHILIEARQGVRYFFNTNDKRWNSFKTVQYSIRIDGTAEDKPNIPEIFSSGGPPAWSPNGEWIAVSVRKDNFSNAFIYNLTFIHTNGKDQITLDLQGSDQSKLGWSPDGEFIAYTKKVNDGVYLLETKCITDFLSCTPKNTFFGEGKFLSWSPEGDQMIIYQNNALYIISIDNQEQKRLPINLEYCFYLDWTFHGIVAQCEYDIYTFQEDGTGIVKLREGGSMPTWTPDGKQIVFKSQAPENKGLSLPNDSSPYSLSSLFIMDADGSNVRRLITRNDQSITWYTWLPITEK